MMVGCGYRLADHSAARGRTISIPVFANKALRPNLESCLTARLVQLYAAESGGRVLPHDQADLELTGAVTSYGEAASSYSAADKVTTYQAFMTADAALREQKSGKVLWKGSVRAVQDYPTSSNLALKLNAEDAALRELCRKLAEEIVRQSGNAF
jgi:hypothetical protein